MLIGRLQGAVIGGWARRTSRAVGSAQKPEAWAGGHYGQGCEWKCSVIGSGAPAFLLGQKPGAGLGIVHPLGWARTAGCRLGSPIGLHTAGFHASRIRSRIPKYENYMNNLTPEETPGFLLHIHTEKAVKRLFLS